MNELPIAWNSFHTFTFIENSGSESCFFLGTAELTKEKRSQQHLKRRTLFTACWPVGTTDATIREKFPRARTLPQAPRGTEEERGGGDCGFGGGGTLQQPARSVFKPRIPFLIDSLTLYRQLASPSGCFLRMVTIPAPFGPDEGLIFQGPYF